MTRLTLLISLVACTILTSACSRDCTAPDGSDSCDAGPVMSTDLDGDFCDDSVCLEVSTAPDQHQVYAWRDIATDKVVETGLLTGGLEFSPSNEPGVLYAASVDWTDNGIALYFDAGNTTAGGRGLPAPLRLEYQR